MEKVLRRLKKAFPNLDFEAGSRFTWSPKTNQIIYKKDSLATDNIAIWSLLHEVGHALLGHNNYQSDFELLALEVAAWQKAQLLAADYDNKIDEDHIQDCLDTYRDWLYQRSTCPTCTSCSLQIDSKTYCCFNCGGTWRVSASRLCRPYRIKQKEVLL
jgi:hypothetical protein